MASDLVPSALVEQACAVAAQQGWYKVEASYTLPCGSRASIVGWRPNTPVEPGAHARAAQKAAPPQETQDQATNTHEPSPTTASEKATESKVLSKAQKKRERAKRKANNIFAAAPNRLHGAAKTKPAQPALGIEERPVSPQVEGVEHETKRPRPAHDRSVCRLPSCGRPCYRDPHTGATHRFCGRSHAAAFAALPADACGEAAEDGDEGESCGHVQTGFMG